MVSLPSASQPDLLPLENGDRLTRPEFERRYRAMPHVKKAELIEGVVYMASPLRANAHGHPHSILMTWLGVYSIYTPGVRCYDNPTVRLDGDNEPQPDAVLRLTQGGGSTISEDDYIEGVPELVVEIAASSAADDFHDKQRVYQRNGVPEYLVWRTDGPAVTWFRWRSGVYEPLVPDQDGILRSERFPGLWLDVPALLQGNYGQVLATLQRGMAKGALPAQGQD